MKRALGISIAALLMMPLCVSATEVNAQTSQTSTTTAEIRVRVFASAAMEKPLRQLGYQFQKQHPNVAIHYEFAASRVFMIGIEQGIPPDLFVSAGEKYQDQLTNSASVNLFSTLAHDHLVAVTPCGPPPPCCEAQGVSDSSGITEKSLVTSLMNPDMVLTIASPTLSPAGQATIDIFKEMDKKRPGAYQKIMGHAKEVMDVDLVARAVAHRESNIGILYASQVTGLERQGECVREVPIPSSYHTQMPFTVSVLNKSRFHAVDAERKEVDKDLEALYLSKAGQKVLAEWGFAPANAIARK